MILNSTITSTIKEMPKFEKGQTVQIISEKELTKINGSTIENIYVIAISQYCNKKFKIQSSYWSYTFNQYCYILDMGNDLCFDIPEQFLKYCNSHLHLKEKVFEL